VVPSQNVLNIIIRNSENVLLFEDLQILLASWFYWASLGCILCGSIPGSGAIFSCFSSLHLLIRVLTSGTCSVLSVAWSEDGRLASGSDDKTVKI